MLKECFFKVRVYCSSRGFMSRMSVFNSPFLLGFDQFERTVDRISKLSSDSYPPYNIEQTSPNSIVSQPIGFFTGSPNISRKTDCRSVSSFCKARRRFSRRVSALSKTSAIRFCSSNGGSGIFVSLIIPWLYFYRNL